MGDNCRDIYLEQEHLILGGNALNVAANCLIAGREANYVGPVGKDAAGREIISAMKDNDIGVDGVFQMDGASGVTLIRLIDNDRELLFEEFGVCGMWTPELPESLTSGGQLDWVHVGGPLTMAADFGAIKPYARLVSVDVSTWKVPSDLNLSSVDIVFASSDDCPGKDVAPLTKSLLGQGAA